MTKDKKFLISSSENGLFLVGVEGQPNRVIDLRKISPEGKFEVLKAEILKLGIYFSPKIEKMVQKEINRPKNGQIRPETFFRVLKRVRY